MTLTHVRVGSLLAAANGRGGGLHVHRKTDSILGTELEARIQRALLPAGTPTVRPISEARPDRSREVYALRV